MKISFDFPESAFSSLRQPPTEFANSMRVAACVKWYELGKVSQAKAAKMAALSRCAFIDIVRESRVPAIQTTSGELEAELAP